MAFLSADQSFTYAYGEAGQTLALDEGTPGTFSAVSDSAVLPLPEGYEIDTFGRVITSPTSQSIEYDAWSRPRQVALKDGRSIEYAYDASGRRVSKVVSVEGRRSTRG